MGLINKNNNSFEVYLTDLGREKFFNGGLKDAISFFSLSDSDNNYSYFYTPENEINDYQGTGFTYNINTVVKYNNNFYIKTSVNPANPTQEYLPTNGSYWNEITVFDTTNINKQRLPMVNHNNEYTTSIKDGGGNDIFINDIYNQTILRGDIVDNKIYDKGLFNVKIKKIKEPILFEPYYDSDDSLGILTYVNNE